MMANIKGGAETGEGQSRSLARQPFCGLSLWGNTSIKTDVVLPSQHAWLHLDFAQFLPHPLHTAHCSEPRLLSSLLGTLWQSPQVTEPASEILISISQDSSSTSYVSQRELLLEDITMIPVFYYSIVVWAKAATKTNNNFTVWNLLHQGS